MSEMAKEAQARLIVKRNATAVWWVEAAKGGTIGLPDCFAVWGDCAGWIECKPGRWRDGRLVADFEPPQVLVARQMEKNGVLAVVLLVTEESAYAARLHRTCALGEVDGPKRHPREVIRPWPVDLVRGPWKRSERGAR